MHPDTAQLDDLAARVMPCTEPSVVLKTVGLCADTGPMTSTVHHAFDYIELTVDDLAAAQRFYAAAFGWEFNDYRPQYAGIRAPGGDGEAGGLNAADPLRGPGGPLVLLWSADLDASAAAVAEAGGRVTQGPYEFPGGRRCHFTDPAGNELGVWGA